VSWSYKLVVVQCSKLLSEPLYIYIDPSHTVASKAYTTHYGRAYLPSTHELQSASSDAMTLGLEMVLMAQLRELVDECSVRAESGDTCGGAVSVAEEACGGTRRRRGSQKRAQGKDEHRRDVVVEPAGSNLQPRCSKRRYFCARLRFPRVSLLGHAVTVICDLILCLYIGYLLMDHWNSNVRCRKKKQGSTCLVISVPDFDGYNWRKYGQKRIEGAMYPRYTAH
jgi:hypothetical protein